MTIGILGCNSSIKKDSLDLDMKSENSLSIDDFYPFLEDSLMKYEGIGNEFAEKTTFFEFIKGNKAQLKVINPGTNFIKIIEKKDGTLREKYYEGQFYHIEDMIGIEEDINNILLKEPLEVGNSWITLDGYKREITGLDIEVNTPLDKFKALEVTTYMKENIVEKTYYAKGIGPIKTIYEDKDNKVEVFLKSIKNRPLNIDIQSFYPTVSELETVYTYNTIDFHTNDSIENQIEDIMKNPPSDKLMPLISKGTSINHIILDRKSWNLNVDFSRELITEMNAGSTLENEIIKSIKNTLGKFYDVDKVIITVDNRTYESGHFILEKDEDFKVDTKGIKEFK